ncbi:MAG: AI-2E family transporter [Patescibacteria group bacterium]
MQTFEISTWSIVKTILVLVAFWLLWQIRDILALLFVVVILVAGLRPMVQWFVSRRVHRVAAVSIIMLLIVGLMILLLSLVIPAIIEQLQFFILQQLPDIVRHLSPYYESITQGRQLLTELVNQLQKVSGNVVAGVISVFGGLVSALTVLALTFYLLLEEHPLHQILKILPATYRDQLALSLERVADKMGGWLRGQLTLSLVVGGATAVAMSLIGVPVPLALGLLAGILEVLPIVGPLIAGVIMVAMAATSPDAALLKISISLAFAVALQFAENQFLVPSIMKQAVGLSPVVVIIALLIGGQLGGIAGAVLAIPLVVIAQVAAQDWPKFKRIKQS